MSLEGNAVAERVLIGKLVPIPRIDNTLTKEGQAAEAKATRAALDELNKDVNNTITTATSKVQSSLDAHKKDKNNPHGVTLAQIGAAPLTDTLTRRGKLTGGSNWDNAYETGIYEVNTWTGSGGTGLPPVKTVGHLIVYSWASSISIADQFVVQELHSYENPNCVLRRICRNGTYTEWEWENPPMELGKEYRTTERHQGKAVYKQFFELGNLPNAGVKSVEVNFSPTTILSHEAHFKTSANTYSNLMGVTVYVVKYGNGTPSVKIITSEDNSSYTGYITVKYTKD